jgi:hypothetical protein
MRLVVQRSGKTAQVRDNRRTQKQHELYMCVSEATFSKVAFGAAAATTNAEGEIRVQQQRLHGTAATAVRVMHDQQMGGG